jgi:hypothetical protein
MRRRIRHNTLEALAEYQVTGLAFLKEVIVFTARSLAVTYPDIDDDPRPGDHAGLVTARQLLADCDHLLNALEEYWHQTAVYLPADHPAKHKTDGHDDDDVF